MNTNIPFNLEKYMSGDPVEILRGNFWEDYKPYTPNIPFGKTSIITVPTDRLRMKNTLIPVIDPNIVITIAYIFVDGFIMQASGKLQYLKIHGLKHKNQRPVTLSLPYSILSYTDYIRKLSYPLHPEGEIVFRLSEKNLMN